MIPLSCVQNISLFPIKQERSPDLLDGITESPTENPPKSKKTLMSPQECDIVRGSPNQPEIKPDYPALAQSNSLFPITHDKWLDSFRQLLRFPETHVSSLQEHQFQHRNSRKAPCTPYHLEKRADSQDSVEQVGQFSTSTSRGAFPQQ